MPLRSCAVPVPVHLTSARACHRRWCVAPRSPLVNTVGRLMQMANPTTTTLWITRPVTGCAVQVEARTAYSCVVNLQPLLRLAYICCAAPLRCAGVLHRAPVVHC